MTIVKANNSSPVRLREAPNGRIIAVIPQGTPVNVLRTQGEWSVVAINDSIGWMMNKFLVESKSNLSELKAEL